MKEHDKSPRTAVLHLAVVEEVSLVDHPANGEKFLIITKRNPQNGTPVVRDHEGNLVTQQERRLAFPEATQLAFEGLGRALSEVGKQLDVNSVAADDAWGVLMDLFDRADALMGLVSNMPRTPVEGTLDPSIATELASMAGSLIRLAEEFGGSPEPIMMSAQFREASERPGGPRFLVLSNDDAGLSEDGFEACVQALARTRVEKIGAKMSRENLGRLQSIVESLVEFVRAMDPEVEKSDIPTIHERIAELTDLVSDMATNQAEITKRIGVLESARSRRPIEKAISLPDANHLAHNDPVVDDDRD